LDALERILAFLDAVRRQIWRRHAVRAALLAAAALAVVAALLPLVALLVMPVQGRVIAMIGLGLVAATAAGAVALGMIVPRRRWRSDHRVARFVGRHEPPIASDLLSAVEFGSGFGQGNRGRVSRELTFAFLAQTAGRVAGVDPAALDARGARRSLHRATAALGLGLLLCAGLAIAMPAQVGDGWRRLGSGLVSDPTSGPFAGASMAVGPLVGDMRITLEYPAYTQRPPQVLSSTSGDFVAIPGTTVTIETWAVEPVTRARLVFGVPAGPAGAPAASAGAPADLSGAGSQSLAPPAAGPASPTSPALPESPAAATPAPAASRASPAPAAPAAVSPDAADEVDMPIGADGRALRARFPVVRPAVYRFWMESARGERRVESQPRRIEIEPDTPPVVALYAPADDLDVTRLERIELAYIAEDDYGISQVSLVWESRGKIERKALPLAGPSQRAQSKLIWDLAELTLEPGVPVTYHLEVEDNDTVMGPKVSRSRSFVLRVFSPREQHEQLIARQRELFEKMLGHLGGRLVAPEAPESDVHAHRILARDTEGLVVEIGTLLAALAEDELADAGLRKALDSMRGRLDGLARAANEALDKVDPAAPARPGTRLAQTNARLVTELEDDVLLLADWLDRQNMENLLAISDEVEGHQERLRRLFDELDRTGSPEIMAEIEREMRALEQRLAEMSHERGNLPEDVLDRFMHAEALPGDETQDCMAEVRARLAAGDAAGAREQMERCMLGLKQAAESMEQSLRALRGERFTEEERRFAQMMNELGDLADDQKQLAGDADELWERYAARADELMRDNMDETRRQVMGTLDKLRRRIDQVPPDDLTPFAQEELEVVEARLADVESMLRDGDMAESLSMARQAQEGIEIMLEELEAALLDEQDEPWGERTREAAGKLRRAQPLARDLVEELEAHTPSPDEIMSPADRQQLERLRRQEQAMAERARRLGERVQQMADSLPGEAGQAVSGGLEQAGAQMGRATERMKRRDPSGARHEARGAAETLERTLEGARGAARRQQSASRDGLRDEPIRIPGAEEYRAPEEFREDILEAMKREQAPEGFGEMVKRYYEELIR
jgi:hypothetical protein